VHRTRPRERFPALSGRCPRLRAKLRIRPQENSPREEGAEYETASERRSVPRPSRTHALTSPRSSSRSTGSAGRAACSSATRGPSSRRCRTSPPPARPAPAALRREPAPAGRARSRRGCPCYNMKAVLPTDQNPRSRTCRTRRTRPARRGRVGPLPPPRRAPSLFRVPRSGVKTFPSTRTSAGSPPRSAASSSGSRGRRRSTRSRPSAAPAGRAATATRPLHLSTTCCTR